jgi:hypothetical protein
MHEISRHTERLPVKLTETELSERGRRLAQLEGDWGQHVTAMKSQQSLLAARKKELEAKIAQLAQTMRDGEELREVPVAVMLDDGKVLEVRTDTGQALGPPREPRPEEMQQKLFEPEIGVGENTVGPDADDLKDDDEEGEH